ncbi:hypothetical protein SAMN02910369_02566 [Lachnospiraceae bacterium NE2001]|nr:hypothetical protein SAMN02910369_02566 [Lachnospiraceae bacterium NE2001]
MIQAMFYYLSFLALWTMIVLYKKSEEKKNLILWLITSGFLVFACQSFTAGLLGIVKIPISALTVGLGNAIYAALMGIWIRKKGIQHYYIKIFDIVAFVAILLILLEFSHVRYGKELYINFVSVDASIHCKSALTVALEHTLPNNMYFASFNTGVMMDAFKGLTGCSPFLLHKIFVLFEIIYTAFSAYLFWVLLRTNGKDKILDMLVALVLTILYWIIYPAYSMIFGFSYFGMSVNILTLLLILLNDYLQHDLDRLFMIVSLNLALFGIFVCYTLFVPTAFFGTFIALGIFMIRRDRKKFINKKNILEMLEVFLIPTILGLLHSFGNVKELSASSGGGITVDGGCYSDLYSNFIILIPFAIIGIYFMIKKKDGVYTLPMMVVQLIFMAILFVGAMNNKVSAYYYMKNNSVLWLMVMFTVAMAICAMMEHFKGAFLFVFFFFFLIFMGMWGDSWVKDRNPRFIAVDAQSYFNALYFSDAFYTAHTWITLQELDLYQYVFDNCTDAETICINDEMENGWFKTLTGNEKTFCYGGVEDYKRLEDSSVGYVCIVYSDPYAVCMDYLSDYEVLYSNPQGMILKVK